MKTNRIIPVIAWLLAVAAAPAATLTINAAYQEFQGAWDASFGPLIETNVISGGSVRLHSGVEFAGGFLSVIHASSIVGDTNYSNCAAGWDCGFGTTIVSVDFSVDGPVNYSLATTNQSGPNPLFGLGGGYSEVYFSEVEIQGYVYGQPIFTNIMDVFDLSADAGDGPTSVNHYAAGNRNGVLPAGRFQLVTLAADSEVYGGVASLNFSCSLGPVGAPLTIAPQPGGTSAGIAATWPAWAENVVLQQNSDLHSTNWVNVTNAPVLTNKQYQISLPVGPGNCFFRLSQP